jgi:hypothetical protein
MSEERLHFLCSPDKTNEIKEKWNEAKIVEWKWLVPGTVFAGMGIDMEDFICKLAKSLPKTEEE